MENIAVYLQKGEFSGREHVDRALKRLKGKMESEGILDTVRSKRAFENETQKRQRKAKSLAKQRRIQKLKRQHQS
jgi:small subunit ribosomal protein S21